MRKITWLILLFIVITWLAIAAYWTGNEKSDKSPSANQNTLFPLLNFVSPSPTISSSPPATISATPQSTPSATPRISPAVSPTVSVNPYLKY